MKFKYKKMVVAITMGTMLIGFVIFSTVTPGASPVAREKNTETMKEGDDVVSPSPAVDTSVIQKDLNEEVTKVVKDYLVASVNCDMDALEETVNNIAMVNEKELQLKYEFVESVHNIECYMIPAPDSHGYLVYVYRELKLKDIETMAPGLSSVYVTEGADGEYRVFFGAADTGVEEFISATDKSKEVTALVDKVEKKMKESQSADADLDAFIKRITGAETQKED